MKTKKSKTASALLLLGILSLAKLSAANSPIDVRRDAVVEAAEKAMPSVVNIATETVVEARDAFDQLFRDFFDPYYRRRPPNTQYSLGSGVIVDEEGFVLTNYHVVARAGRIVVKLADGREFEAQQLVGAALTDLALLKLKAPAGERFTAVDFAADDDLLLGETVLALGNPFGLGGTVTRGILSSKSRRPAREGEPMDVPDWLQTDAAINPGNSGGPLVNLKGQLIGINVAIYREAQGIGFAIPIQRISAALGEIYSPEVLADLWFGARIKPGVTPLRILSVEPDSPAAQAGLEPGDKILEVNGQHPAGFIQFQRDLLRDKSERHSVTLKIDRDKKIREIKLRLLPEIAFFNAELIRKKTGISLQEATAALRRRLNLPGVEGTVIAGVDKGSPAEKAGLEPGMLVTNLAGRSSTNLIDAARFLHGKHLGEKITLGVVVPRQRGPFVEYREVTVDLALR